MKAIVSKIVGNLLDNAFKYGDSRILIGAGINGRNETLDKHWLSRTTARGCLSIVKYEQILNRGTRLDEATEGQGIGLAVVADIVDSYSIELNFQCRGKLGGLRSQSRNFTNDLTESDV